MQSVPAWMYEAMAIVVFVMGILVVLVGTTWIILAFHDKYLADFAAPIGLCVAVILGGGLIWLGLHYGFQFHERLLARNLVSQPVPDKPADSPPGIPRQSLACNTVEAKYGLIIDAGSSGSRIYIYCWRPAEANANGTPWVTAARAQVGERPWLDEGGGPLSKVSNEMDAETVLEPLIDYVKKKIGNDPQTLAQTPLHLMATAGMRLKVKEDQDKIIETVETYLRKTFPSATSEVISGEDEALYGWIAVNYLLGFLKEKDGNSSPTMGILELGGASTQIAYASSDPSPQGLFTLPWGDTTYQIYRHSADKLGQDQAKDKIDAVIRIENSSKIKGEKKLNPCYPNGYLKPGDSDLGQGAGDYDICKEKIEKTLPWKEMNQPRLPQEGVFLAYSGYYYTHSHFIRLLGTFPLAELEEAGKIYCSSDLKELKSYKNYNEKYWPHYCFTAGYIAALLQTGYGFPKNTQQIIITDTLHGNAISWTLGAMIYKELVPSSASEGMKR
jgi:apyrase